MTPRYRFFGCLKHCLLNVFNRSLETFEQQPGQRLRVDGAYSNSSEAVTELAFPIDPCDGMRPSASANLPSIIGSAARLLHADN